MTSSAAPLRLEYAGPLATLSLANPGRGNTIDSDFARALLAAASALWDRPGVRAVLLRADGPNFCFGGDLKAFAAAGDALAPLVRSWTADMHMGLQRLWQLPVPIVCAVQGFSMGGGTALMAGTDIVVAGASTRVGSAFTQVGFSCDSGSSASLTARMGMSRSRRFMLLAEVLGSEEALQCGLVDQVVADAQLQDEALALATRLADGPTLAYGAVKRLFLRAGATALEAQLELEAQTLAQVSGSADAREGIAAMSERRKPVFRGV